MKRLSGPQGKRNFLHRHVWRCVFLAGLLVPALFCALASSMISPVPVFAAVHTSAKNAFSTSPTSGPVGAVITVQGSGGFLADGTQVNLGYTIDYRTCNIVAGGQAGVVQQGSFSGWFRWPSSTGTGNFGVCISANNLTFQVGSYQVLSASPPRVSMVTTTPKAGSQATVSGANFLPGGTSVTLLWNSVNGGQGISLGTVVSSSAGTFTYTFTVPARASTGYYTLTGEGGGGSPMALSAGTTFHVNGITIVALPTPVTKSSPTAAPTSAPAQTATVAPSGVVAHPQVNISSVGSGDKTGLFLAIGAGGIFLIVLASGAGVLVVRKQRKLATVSAPFPVTGIAGPQPWQDVAGMLSSGRTNTPVHMGASAFTPLPGAMYPGGNLPSGNPGMEYTPLPGPAVPNAGGSRSVTIPFDPGLAEAMREAQVSLFATPRPPLGEEIEVS